MTDSPHDWTIPGGLGAGISAAGVAVWRFFVHRSEQREIERKEQAHHAECQQRIDELQKQHDARHFELTERVEKLEREKGDCYERLIREIGRGAELAMAPRSVEDPPPASLPPPDWSEDTQTKEIRRVIEQEGLARAAARWRAATARKAIVIDNEAVVATALRRVLETLLPGWSVMAETDPRKGLHAIQLDEGIALAFVDLDLDSARLDGVQLVETATRERPELRGRIFVVTGLDPTEEQLRRVSAAGGRVLQKAAVPEALRSAVREFMQAR